MMTAEAKGQEDSGVEAKRLGAKIQALRRAAGLTQQQLAVAADLRLSTLAQIEQGHIVNPRWDTMRKLADTLKVSLDELADTPE